MPELLVGVIALLIVVFGAMAVYFGRETRAETRKTGKFPEGHYRGRGMGIGIAIGAGLGVAMENIAIGIPIGIAFGVAIGGAMEKKHADELRPMTEKEIKMKQQALMLTIGLLLLTALAAAGAYFLRPT